MISTFVIPSANQKAKARLEAQQSSDAFYSGSRWIRAVSAVVICEKPALATHRQLNHRPAASSAAHESVTSAELSSVMWQIFIKLWLLLRLQSSEVVICFSQLLKRSFVGIRLGPTTW